MKMLKFGGSSVGSPEKIRQIASILKNEYAKGVRFSLVVSAFGGVTDDLLSLAQMASKADSGYFEKLDAVKKRHLDAAADLLRGEGLSLVQEKLEKRFANLLSVLKGIHAIRETTPRSRDYIVSFGERNSAFVIAQFLTQAGIPANYLDARKVLLTDNSYGGAVISKEVSYQRIKEWYAVHPGVAVITGFVAADSEGITTTLGRGGSDYTCALFGAAMDVDTIEIWTDVNGILTADPRVVKDAQTLLEVTYAEAMEMSHFGAKVIYPPTIQPALEKEIPIYIKNTFNPDFEGTRVSATKAPNKNLITGMASIGHVVLLTLRGSGMIGVPGFAARLFGCLADGGINIIMITQGSSEHSISFAVAPQDAPRAKALVEAAFSIEFDRQIVDPIKIENDLSIVAIIGEKIKHRHGISATLFKALGANGVNVVAIAQGSSELNISVVIHKSDEKKALNAIHETFFQGSITKLHVFMVGVGLIGKTLLRQIAEQNKTLKKEHQLEIVLTGLSNSRKMSILPQGIDIKNWKQELDKGEAASLPTFIQKMASLNLRNTIFVDCTASGLVPKYYEQILENNISVSTPNKVAASSSYLQYKRLKQLATNNNVLYEYETNVGAALPIISTIQDLMHTGDQIKRIEGVLSGSLSYIFNSFKAGTKFSDIVKQAQQDGLTEPDPRDDLSGQDVSRKIIILAREAGHAIDMEDVAITPILPENCIQAPDVDAFFKELEASDDYFETMRQKAETNGKVLRMIASYENGECTVGLQEVDSENAFYNLSGSDNMLSLSTTRYNKCPLVVRGPGAGAEVTAAGVFAEIVKIGKFL